MVNFSDYKRVSSEIQIESNSTTHIEQAIFSTIAGLEDLKSKVNANDVVRTTKQNAMVTAVESAINDLYGKLEAIGNMSATDLENLESLIKSANDIVSNGVNGLVKAIDSILKELNKSKQIEFVNDVIDSSEGILNIAIPVNSNDVFVPFVFFQNKPHNASEIIGVNSQDSTLQIKLIDTAHFVSAKVPFDCSTNPIEVKVGIIKTRVNLLSFEIEKPTESLEDSIDSKDTVNVGLMGE